MEVSLWNLNKMLITLLLSYVFDFALNNSFKFDLERSQNFQCQRNGRSNLMQLKVTKATIQLPFKYELVLKNKIWLDKISR